MLRSEAQGLAEFSFPLFDLHAGAQGKKQSHRGVCSQAEPVQMEFGRDDVRFDCVDRPAIDEQQWPHGAVFQVVEGIGRSLWISPDAQAEWATTAAILRERAIANSWTNSAPIDMPVTYTRDRSTPSRSTR